MCKDEEWILRHNTLLKAPVPISLAFHSLTEKQVCAANSAGILSQSQTSAFKAREKKTNAECNYCILFKSQGEICVVYPCFFSIVLCLCYCQHVLWPRSWSFLTGIDKNPRIFAAWVLQVVSKNRTSCSCLQTSLWNFISFLQLDSLLCFCKSFRHSFLVSCQFPEMVLTWWKSLTPQGYSTLAIWHVGC